MDAHRPETNNLGLFPVELVSCIVEHLDRDKLLPLRSLSRSWRDAVTPFVFTSLLFHDNQGETDTLWRRESVNRFRSTWIDPATPADEIARARLGTIARILDLSDTFIGANDARQLVQQLPNVMELRLGHWWAIVNWSLNNDNRDPTELLQSEDQAASSSVSSVLNQLLNTQPISDDLANAIGLVFEAIEPQITRLHSYGLLPSSVFLDGLLPHLSMLRHLDLRGPKSNQETRVANESRFYLHHFDVIQRQCPNLESLAFTHALSDHHENFADAEDTLANKYYEARHHEGHDDECDACLRPWMSLRSLTIEHMRTFHATLVPGIVAYLCVKLPQLEHLTVRGSLVDENSRDLDEVFLGAQEWHEEFDSSVRRLPNLASLNLDGSYSPMFLAPLSTYLSHSTTGIEPALTTMTLSSSRNRVLNIDMLNTLAQFPNLRELTVGHNVRAVSNDTIVPPPHFHPLRYLKMSRQALNSAVWSLLSFLCPDLEHVEFCPDGARHPGARAWADLNYRRMEGVTDLPPEQWLPPDAQENIDIVRQLQQFDRGIIGDSDTVHWITLHRTRHLEQMNIRMNQARVIWFIQCADESADEGDQQSPLACHGWYHIQSNASAPTPIPFDTWSWILDRHGQWEEAVSFRPDAPPVPVDPLFSTMPETIQQAKKWARATGIVAILMPYIPRQLIINGHKVSVINDDQN